MPAAAVLGEEIVLNSHLPAAAIASSSSGLNTSSSFSMILKSEALSSDPGLFVYSQDSSRGPYTSHLVNEAYEDLHAGISSDDSSLIRYKEQKRLRRLANVPSPDESNVFKPTQPTPIVISSESEREVFAPAPSPEVENPFAVKKRSSSLPCTPSPLRFRRRGRASVISPISSPTRLPRSKVRRTLPEHFEQLGLPRKVRRNLARRRSITVISITSGSESTSESSPTHSSDCRRLPVLPKKEEESDSSELGSDSDSDSDSKPARRKIKSSYAAMKRARTTGRSRAFPIVITSESEEEHKPERNFQPDDPQLSSSGHYPIGTSFPTLREATEAILAAEEANGYKFRLAQCKRRKDGSKSKQVIRCSCYGIYKAEKSLGIDPVAGRHGLTCRTGCSAHVNLNKCDCQWLVTSASFFHNHGRSIPEGGRAQRPPTAEQKSMVSALAQRGGFSRRQVADVLKTTCADSELEPRQITNLLNSHHAEVQREVSCDKRLSDSLG